MKVKFDFWACRRPLTSHWGSGQVFQRIEKNFGLPDACFGRQDQVPDNLSFYDKTNGFEWKELPLANDFHSFGYWDPPYDKLYKKEGQEIWRVCRRLAILHTFIWPRAWLERAEREAMVAITMGPLKQVRCLQIFKKIPDTQEIIKF